MDLRRPFLVAAWCVACLLLPLSLSAHGPSENHKEAAAHDEEAMRAQHEKDAPHKNVAKAKEFHGLYVEMEKRAKGLQATLKAGDLPKAGIAYGKILEICAICQRKFRD